MFLTEALMCGLDWWFPGPKNSTDLTKITMNLNLTWVPQSPRIGGLKSLSDSFRWAGCVSALGPRTFLLIIDNLSGLVWSSAAVSLFAVLGVCSTKGLPALETYEDLLWIQTIYSIYSIYIYLYHITLFWLAKIVANATTWYFNFSQLWTAVVFSSHDHFR